MTTLRVYKATGDAGGGSALRVFAARGEATPTSGNTLRVYKAKGRINNLVVVRITGPMYAEPFETIVLDAGTSDYPAGSSFLITQPSGPANLSVTADGTLFKIKMPAVDNDLQTMSFQIQITDPVGAVGIATHTLTLYPVFRYACQSGAWHAVERRTILAAANPL